MKKGYADTPEGQIHFVTEGEGEPLLLLHQSPRSSRTYEKIIPLLAKDYRVIAMDTLGCGNSDPLPANVGIRIEDLAQNVIHFLDALNLQKCNIFGVHTGATIGAEVAAGWPTRVDGLILFGFPMIEPGAERESILSDRPAISARSVKLAGDGSHLLSQWTTSFASVVQMWWDTGSPPMSNLTPDLLHFVSQRMLDLAQAKDSTLAIFTAVYGYESDIRLPLIQARTLHIEGTSSIEAAYCRRSDRVKELIPNCKLTTFERADSNAPDWRATDVTETIVNFLRQD